MKPNKRTVVLTCKAYEALINELDQLRFCLLCHRCTIEVLRRDLRRWRNRYLATNKHKP
jgi:hypothetical protein